jgi:hypothetical protein
MLVLVMLGGSQITCGSSKTLNRGKAEALIRQCAEFVSPRFERIFLGPDFRQTDFIGIGNWQCVDALLSLGYLERKGGRIALTSAGETACKDTPRDANRPNARAFAAATREMVAITDIADSPYSGSAGNVKEVRFTWKLRLTPLGDELRRIAPILGSRHDPDLVREGRALFALHDNGWKIEKIEGI